MGYKLLGYVVWQGGKWYLRRRFPHAGRKLAIGGAVTLVLLGGAVAFGAQRRGNGA
jgi:hypothetical protein